MADSKKDYEGLQTEIYLKNVRALKDFLKAHPMILGVYTSEPTKREIGSEFVNGDIYINATDNNVYTFQNGIWTEFVATQSSNTIDHIPTSNDDAQSGYFASNVYTYGNDKFLSLSDANNLAIWAYYKDQEPSGEPSDDIEYWYDYKENKLYHWTGSEWEYTQKVFYVPNAGTAQVLNDADMTALLGLSDNNGELLYNSEPIGGGKIPYYDNNKSYPDTSVVQYHQDVYLALADIPSGIKPDEYSSSNEWDKITRTKEPWTFHIVPNNDIDITDDNGNKKIYIEYTQQDNTLRLFDVNNNEVYSTTFGSSVPLEVGRDISGWFFFINGVKIENDYVDAIEKTGEVRYGNRRLKIRIKLDNAVNTSILPANTSLEVIANRY